MNLDNIFTIQIRYKWWLPIYLNTLCLLCEMSGTEPDEDKLAYWMHKGLKTITLTRSENSIS